MPTTAEQKAARAAYMREYRKRNPEKFKELDKRLAEAKKARDPDKVRQQANERSRRYWERKKAAMTPEERERINAANRERNAKYRAKDPERYRKKKRETAKRLYAKNPQKFLDLRHRRRAALDEGSVTLAEWREIKSRYGYRCAYCRKFDVALTMDHVQALTKGGRHCPENVVPACRPCNTRKNNKPVPFPAPPEDADRAPRFGAST